VAEQLGLEQVGRDRAAIHDDERAACPGARVVDRFGDAFLAGAGLALDQHRRVGRRDSLELREQLAHLRADPDERPERVAVGPDDLGLTVVEVDPELPVAEHERRAAAERTVGDRDGIGDGAVAAAEVACAHPVAGDRELAVEARHRRIVDDQIVGRVRADRAALGDLFPGPTPAGPAVTRTRNRRIARRTGAEAGRVLFGPDVPSITIDGSRPGPLIRRRAAVCRRLTSRRGNA